MTSIIKVNEIQDAGGNTILSSNGTGTFTSNLPNNTPAFHAYLSSTQSGTNSSFVKLNANTEVYDTDNCYDNSTNYRFTPNVAGKYYFYLNCEIAVDAYAIFSCGLLFYKNNSQYSFQQNAINSNVLLSTPQHHSQIIDMNGTTDYVEAYIWCQRHTGTVVNFNSNNKATYFGAYKIIE